MHAVGIICEYNPFHNGHLYHLNETKKMFPDHTVILVLGGNFLQRGEPSIIDKWDKTKIALSYGVDLVIELPYSFATQSADIFAKGSVTILNHLQVEYLVFGSESNDIDKLIRMAKTQIDNPIYEALVKDYLDKGTNYPTALANALKDILKDDISTPNDILGITYIRELLKLKSKIKPLTIKRTNDYHSLELKDDIVSASSIRKALKDKVNVSKYVPELTYQYLQNNLHFMDDYFPFLKYKILTNIDNLSIYHTVDEGIENRIKKEILNAVNTDDLIHKIKTKRYTYSKIRRMLTHIMCNFTKEDAKRLNEITFLRVLGFSNKGKEYLNSIRKTSDIKILTNFEKNNEYLDLELKATSVYASILNEIDKNKVIQSEYKNKPIKKDE
jgi:predicted nucleotidyltransferase